MLFYRSFLLLLIIVIYNVYSLAQNGIDNSVEIDYSRCQNCDVFPEEFMKVNEPDLLDLGSMPPERQLDFLIGEWQLYYPADKSPGYEKITWFVEGSVIEAFQEWTYVKVDTVPWRAKSFFRYIKKENRWQFHWIASASSSLFSGQLNDRNEMVFYENEYSGGPDHLEFNYPVKYLFKNITPNSFLIEWYDSDDNGSTYPYLVWRLYYKKRAKYRPPDSN